MMLYNALYDWMCGKRWTDKVHAHVQRLTDGWVALWNWNTEIREIGWREVDQLIAKRDNGKRSAAALNQERMYLKMFWQWMLERGLAENDPTNVWKRRREVVKKKYVALNPAQMEMLLEAIHGDYELYKFVSLAAYTGLRMGTLLKLRYEHFRDGILEVPAALVKTRMPLRFQITG